MSAVLENPEAGKKTRVTAAQLELLPDGKRFELVAGELVEKAMGNRLNYIGTLLVGLIYQFVKSRNIGAVYGPDTGYKCFKNDADKVRRPDVSVILKGRLKPSDYDLGFMPIAPDLAVEVLSPHDNAEQIEAKIQEYLGAGVRLVWIVYPNTSQVYVHRPDGSVQKLGVEDELSGEQVLPAFKCRVAELFEMD